MAVDEQVVDRLVTFVFASWEDPIAVRTICTGLSFEAQLGLIQPDLLVGALYRSTSSESLPRFP